MLSIFVHKGVDSLQIFNIDVVRGQSGFIVCKNKAAAAAEKEKKPAREATPRHQKSSFEKAADSALSTIGREVGKSLVRGLFDVLKR